MKKTNFLKSLALAVVALVSVGVTSCSEEELKINEGTVQIPEIPELAEPVASLAMTVVDYESGSVLMYEVSDISAYIGGTYPASCPVIDGYTTAKSIAVNVPSIGKGQAIVIPVTFYVVSLDSAVKELIESLGGTLPVDPTEEVVKTELPVTATGGLAIEDGVITNTSEVAVEMEISIPYKSGYEYRGVISRAISLEDLQRLTPTTLIHKMTITVPAQSCVTIVATQEKTPLILTIDEAEYGLWYYEKLVVSVTADSISHGIEHGHGHGHGDSSNAGGGVTEAE